MNATKPKTTDQNNRINRVIRALAAVGYTVKPGRLKNRALPLVICQQGRAG